RIHHVGGHDVRVAKLFLRVLEIRFRPGSQGDARALASKHLRAGEADTFAASGDENDLALQSKLHGGSPLWGIIILRRKETREGAVVCLCETALARGNARAARAPPRGRADPRRRAEPDPQPEHAAVLARAAHRHYRAARPAGNSG